MIKVSVVVPVYNGASYIQECLECILSQTLEEIEVLCVNDASTDSTAAILQTYMERDKRVKIITNRENVGPGVSRNRGLRQAKGKYIIFLDVDDIFEKEMLKEAFNRAEIYRSDICIFREDFFQDGFDENMVHSYPHFILKRLEHIGVFSPYIIKDVIFNLWNGWTWDKLFRRGFILKAGICFQEMRSSEDGFFVHGALVAAERLTCINRIFVHHRIDVAFSVSNSRNKSWQCCYWYLKELKKYLIKNNQYIYYEKSFINWASDFLYWNYRTLNQETRELLFYALKQYMFEELNLLKYVKEEFYNPFYFWFIHTVYESDSYSNCTIPVSETDMWISMLNQNERKIEKLFQFLEKKQYYAAIWGLGVRGKAFLERYGDRRKIRKVYDQDSRKAGQVIWDRYIVEPFNVTTCEGIDVIIVTNTGFYDSIVKTVKCIKQDIKILNFDIYLNPGLSFPLSLEECICRSVR